VAEKIENPAEEIEEEAEATVDECPECGAIVREVKMGTHRFIAHDVDRRDSSTDNPGNPTPPPEKEHKPEREGQEKGKPHFWFGDRYHRK